ncbi:hypothetical protein HHI36_002696 [Cryptolaemus montrouzieri]|uniref:Uncharacterized protein n=1 Tax=Cryptolaemus montrouzieri TaxID=559131 RepID=A0ABD2PB79_9CUCU
MQIQLPSRENVCRTIRQDIQPRTESYLEEDRKDIRKNNKSIAAYISEEEQKDDIDKEEIATNIPLNVNRSNIIENSLKVAQKEVNQSMRLDRIKGNISQNLRKEEKVMKNVEET